MEENQNVQPIVEQIAADAAVVVVEPTLRKFKIGVHQVLEDGAENSHVLTFSLPEDIAGKLGVVLGTAINRIYQKMNLAKTFKQTFIKGTQPLVLKIEAEHWVRSLNIGKVTEEHTEVLKLNNGLLSKRSFVDKVVDLVNFVELPVQIVDVADVKESINTVLWQEQPKIKNEGIKSVAATREAADRVIVLN